MLTTVSIVRDTDLERKTTRAIELIGGMEKFVRRGDRVMIKPNLVDGAPHETGETVHPTVVRTLIEMAYDAGAAKVIVGEGPTWRDLTLHHQYEEMAKETNAEMVDFNKEPFDKVSVRDPVYFNAVRMAHALLDCDVFINVPTLKTHHIAGLTVALKNLYGAIPREDKGLYHRMDKIDLNIVRPSHLIVVDGTYSTHHIPPFEKHELNLALAGTDPVAVDTIAAMVMGVNPKTLRYLSWAEARGLGTADPKQIRVAGLPIEQAYRRNTVTSVDFVNRKYKRIKLLNGEACTGCFGRIATELFKGYKEDTLKEDLYILMGPRVTLPSGNVILCGNCLAPTFYNKLRGTFIPGCPPDLQELRKVLKDFGVNVALGHP
ncbi:MAG: DUF362 domain-containing protein [Candidatus Bathyarchaeia archaeon]